MECSCAHFHVVWLLQYAAMLTPEAVEGHDHRLKRRYIGTTQYDFFDVIAAWGPNPGHPADFDGNDEVDAVDFFDLIAHWGPCP